MTGGTNLNATYSINPGTLDFLGNTLPGSPAFVGCMSVSGTAPNNYEATVYALDPVVSYRLAESSGSNAYDNALSMGPAVLTSVTLGGASIATIDGGTTGAAFNGTSSVARHPDRDHLHALGVQPGGLDLSDVGRGGATIVNLLNSTTPACNLYLAANVLYFLVKDTSGNALLAHPASYTVSANVPIHVVGVWPGGNTLLIYVRIVAGGLLRQHGHPFEPPVLPDDRRQPVRIQPELHRQRGADQHLSGRPDRPAGRQPLPPGDTGGGIATDGERGGAHGMLLSRSASRSSSIPAPGKRVRGNNASSGNASERSMTIAPAEHARTTSAAFAGMLALKTLRFGARIDVYGLVVTASTVPTHVITALSGRESGRR